MDNQPSHDDGPRVGYLLRASRLRCGKESDDIARALHIRLPYVEAIEDGRYDDLPGATYAVGFVRAYAEHLGLDSEEVARRFKAETSGLETSTELKFLSPIPENGIPRGAILFVGMVVAVLAYGSWYVSSTRDHFLTDLIPPLPDRLAALLPTSDATDAKAPPSGPDTALAATAAPPVTTPVEIVMKDPIATPLPVAPSAAPGPADSVAETAPPIEVTPAAEVAEIAKPSPVEATPVAVAAPVTAPGPEPEPATQAVAEITETMPPPRADRGQEPTAGDPSSSPDAAPPIPIAETTTASEPAAPVAPPPPVGEAVADVQQPAPPVAPNTKASPDTMGPAKDIEEVAETTPPEAAGGEDGDQVAALTEDAAAKDEVAPPKDAVTATDGSESRIVVRARMASWIQVRDDVGNQLLMTRLMRAGDTFRVPDRPGLTLLTGNAGALEILVDGETMPPLGPIGAVRRDVTLDIERLREGTAAVE